MRKHLSLLFILIIALALRFIFLGDVPVGFHRDEAFLGYNAYSILKTGRDMSGTFLPLHLKAFLYSPAGYSYFSIPFIWIFGLSTFSVRFASALFGSFSVLLVYVLVNELFSLFGGTFVSKFKSNQIGLLSAGMLAISPWHINLSRTATENTVVVFFTLLGVILFLRFIRKPRFVPLFFAYLSFFITLFTYQSPRAFLPIFIPFLVIIFWKKLVPRNIILISGLFVIFIILPVMGVLRSPELSTRIRTLNIVAYPQTKIMINDWIATDGALHVPYVLTRAFHNKLTGYFFTYSENLASYFSYGFLFSDKGLPDRYRVPSVGLFYPYETILIVISAVYLLSKVPVLGVLLFGWIVISFSGSALTFDDIPNLQRTLMAAPVFSILSGFGLFTLYRYFVARNKIILGLALVLGVILYFACFYVIQYYSYGRVYRPWYRQDGYSELVSIVNTTLESYSSAVITTREGSPTIFFLFYSRYNPQNFQEETKHANTVASDHINFGKYIFSDEECPLRVDNVTKQLTGTRGVVYVNSSLCGKNPTGTHMVAELHRIDGSKVFQILTRD